MAMNSRASLYSSYGAAPGASEFALQNNHAKHNSARSVQSVGALTVPPWLTYAFMAIVFAMAGSGPFFYFACLLAGICLSFSLLFAWVYKNNVKGQQGYYMFLSILCFAATVNGIMAGLTIHAKFYGQYYNYRNRPTYTDVLPTDPAAAHSDGSIIGFAGNTVVDTMRAGNMLSTDGKRYCVAPVLDESQQAAAEVWAVGVDCCAGHVSFYCDDAQDLQAKSGAVVFDMKSRFAPPLYENYIKAVKQAAGRYSMKIPPKPILVRWLVNPNNVTEGIWWDGTLHLFLGIGFYFLVSGILALALHMCGGAGSTTPRA